MATTSDEDYGTKGGGFQAGARVPMHAVSDQGISALRALYAQHGREITDEEAREVLQQSVYFFYQLWLAHEERFAEGGQQGAPDPTTGEA